MSAEKPLALVAGAGSGLGSALLSRFERGGYRVVGIGRSKPDQTVGSYVQMDLSDSDSAPAALTGILAEHGTPQVVIHNTAELVIAPFSETSPADFQRTWSSMVQTAVLLAQATMEPMSQTGKGAFIVSGATASLRGGAKFSAFASAKFALRGLTQSLAREYQGHGIHVVHMILDGIIDTPRSRELHSLDPSRMMKSQELAEAYWQAAHQPSSTWTHEMDLRPQSESF